MATNRGRPRKMDKAGDKADFKNTLDKYSWSEKETPTRERGMEVMMEKIEKMERGFEAMIKEIKGIFEKQVEEMKREIKRKGKEVKEREREREREKRRKDIVIKGIDWNEGSNEGTVKEFIREKMKIEAEI